MKLRTTGSLLLASIFLLSAFALANSSAQTTEESFRERARRVRVAEVAATGGPQSVRFSGVTRSVRHADLGFGVGGRLASRAVQVGQRVARGESLAQLERRELELAVTAAEAGAADAEARRARAAAERSRVERLYAAQAATSEELEQVVAVADASAAALDGARARLGEARRLLGETLLPAPFGGVVTEVHAEEGEVLAAGWPVVSLSGEGQVEVEVRLPENVAPGVEQGQRVAVELPLAGLATEGEVVSVGRAASAGGLFPALVRLDPQPGLLPGMSAEVRFELAVDGTLTVPLAAVLNPGGARPRVFRLAGDRVEAVEVEVDRLVGDRVAVRAKLAPGDQVVVTGHTALVAGDRVEVLP